MPQRLKMSLQHHLLQYLLTAINENEVIESWWLPLLLFQIQHELCGCLLEGVSTICIDEGKEEAEESKSRIQPRCPKLRGIRE